MTLKTANRPKIMLLAAAALGLLVMVPSLAHRHSASAVEDVMTAEENDLSMGRNPCCLILPDDWIYWDR